MSPIPGPERPSPFHLVEAEVWERTGTHLHPPSLSTEGFVHLSWADQVEGSADRHLSAAVALLALRVDPDLADAPIRVEDSYGSGTAFPHLYGPLPRAAVREVVALERDDEGRWRWPADHGRG